MFDLPCYAKVVPASEQAPPTGYLKGLVGTKVKLADSEVRSLATYYLAVYKSREVWVAECNLQVLV